MADGSVTIDTKLNDDGIEKGVKSLKGNFNKIGNIAKTALKGITIAAGTTATAFAGIVTASVKARGELEQQIGGIETLFKNNADKVIENANKAYKTAGLSAIEYMSTATSFSASLLQSLGNDTAKAAEIADMAIIDMSDNANKMGTSMEMIQNAYQGFAKQNYTMLDNLKLGYGGTKTEMERLLADAEKLTGIKYDINNLNDVYNAIHVIQGELGITGTTAKEASETLQGSMASLSASWNNFLSGAGDFSDVLEAGEIALSNITRIAKEAIGDIIGELGKLLNNFLQPIKEWIEEHKTMLTILVGIIGTLTAAIIAYTVAKNADLIIMSLYTAATTTATAVTTAFGAVMAFITSPITLVVVAIGALITIIVLLIQNWDTVKQKTIEIWNNIVDWFKELPR